MKFRFHTGYLAASMDTLVTIPSTMQALRNLLCEVYQVSVQAKVTVETYFPVPDTRTGWPQTCAVKVDGLIIGFTDEVPPDASTE
jgi:hypothetical protein